MKPLSAGGLRGQLCRAQDGVRSLPPHSNRLQRKTKHAEQFGVTAEFNSKSKYPQPEQRQHPNSHEKPAQTGKSWSEERAGNVKDTSTSHGDTGAQRSLLIMVERGATSSHPHEHRQPATSCIWSQEGWGCFRLKGHCRPQNNPPHPLIEVIDSKHP